ncbi:MAG TPA: hypothetical protein VMP11_04560 [Verrucomicrobiae bacterium]|nr:hypothetical protein [Verrucomicrobiae bacterium]
MNENKLKHLEFIQAIITRMSSNQFMLKGWCVTLVSALFALAAKDANHSYFVLGFIPVAVFWFLDAYYLSLERQYRALYGDVAARKPEDVDFSLDASAYNSGKNTWLACLWRPAVSIFYGVLFAAVVVVVILLTT